MQVVGILLGLGLQVHMLNGLALLIVCRAFVPVGVRHSLPFTIISSVDRTYIEVVLYVVHYAT